MQALRIFVVATDLLAPEGVLGPVRSNRSMALISQKAVKQGLDSQGNYLDPSRNKLPMSNRRHGSNRLQGTCIVLDQRRPGYFNIRRASAHEEGDRIESEKRREGNSMKELTVTKHLQTPSHSLILIAGHKYLDWVSDRLISIPAGLIIRKAYLSGCLFELSDFF